MTPQRIAVEGRQSEQHGKAPPVMLFFYTRKEPRAKHPKKGVVFTALTRKMLKAMGIEDDKAEQIIEANAESIEALRNQRDEARATAEQYKADAEKLPAVQQELDSLKNDQTGNPYKAQYENEHAAFEKYKAEVEAKETAAKKEAAYRKLLTDTGVSEGIIDLIIKGDPVEIEFDDKGEIKDAAKLTDGIKTKWAKYIVQEDKEGYQTHNQGGTGSHDNGGNGMSRAAQIAANYAKERYGVDPSAK